MGEPPLLAPDGARPDGNRIVTNSAEGVAVSSELEEVEGPDQAPGPRFSNEEHRAKATKLLALLLFWALIAIFIAHFGSAVWLTHDKPNSVEEVSRVFNTWIPVFSGLFASAATLYFTQGRK